LILKLIGEVAADDDDDDGWHR